jgi:16S rRNA C967 or C1407 C5-methylase (RsmB/RsmF family)
MPPHIFQHLLKSIQKHTDIDENLFLQSFDESPSTSILINTNKIEPQFLDFELSNKVHWNNNGYYLSTRPQFYADPLFYAGAYYVMDSSSLFLEYILHQINLSKSAIALDIAAAPGGKSIILSHYLDETGLLYSNEINYNRAKILSYNLAKWGKCNYIATNNDSQVFQSAEQFFDAVLCDVPCTGSGLFRKFPEWANAFNDKLIQDCVYRQKKILSNIFSSLKENGYLIYSTCSYTSEENEDIAQFILQNGFKIVDIQIPKEWGIIKTKYGIRFFPHLTSSEGFFYSVFQKKKHFSPNLNDNKKNFYHSLKEIKFSEKVHFLEWINLKDFHSLYQWKNYYYLSNTKNKEIPSFDSLKLISIGTKISDNLHLPAPELALSNYLNKEIIPNISLSRAEAQHFLKKEPLKINAEKKLYLMSYKNLGFGWAKVLENRLNNYFPSEWRILKELPEN